MQRAVSNVVCACVIGRSVPRHNEATLSRFHSEMSPLSQSTVSTNSRISLAVFLVFVSVLVRDTF